MNALAAEREAGSFDQANQSVITGASRTRVQQVYGEFGEVGWMTGLEPAASGATVRCSTFELHPPWE